MKIANSLLHVSLLSLLPAVFGCSAREPAGEVADTVYTNGKIYTVDEAQPWAEAVAIKDGKFLVVGSDADVEAVTGDGTEVVDLGGSFAMPGIGDTHIHPGLLMAKRAFCALPGTFYEPTEEEIMNALAQCVEDLSLIHISEPTRRRLESRIAGCGGE